MTQRTRNHPLPLPGTIPPTDAPPSDAPSPNVDATSTPDPIPRQLGEKLDVIQVIGSGGMGTVLEVFHNVMGIKRAAKLLDAGLFRNSEQALQRFRQEALIASELSHPNIIKVFDLDRAPDGTPYILMELLEGQNLEDLIEHKAPMPLSTVIQLLAGPADALDAVHRKGIVHRDLKPANLFATTQGTVKILDFGISQFATPQNQDARITRAGEIVGTPMYMSPEQVLGESLDGRTDIYAMGIIAYEMLTGKCVYPYESVNQITAAVLVEPPVPPGDIDPRIPAHVNDVLARCLSKERTERYPDTLSFLRDLAGPTLSQLVSGTIRSDLISAVNSSELYHDDTNTPVMDRTATLRLGPTTHSIPERQSGTLGDIARKRWKIAGLTATALVIITMGAFLLHAATFKEKINIIAVTDIAVHLPDGHDNDHPWTQDAIATVLNLHLEADPVIKRVSQSGLSSSGTFDLNTRHYRLDLDATFKDTWTIDLQLNDKNSERVWHKQITETGFETAIEALTWDLHHFLAQRSPTKQYPLEDKELSRLARRSISTQHLRCRLHRLKERTPDTPVGEFWNGLTTYLECLPGRSPDTCLQETPFPTYRETNDAEINAIWRTMVSSNPDNLSFDFDCAAFQRTGDFARTLSPSLPGRHLCKTAKETICTDVSTFWKRYECAMMSSRTDTAGTSLAYVFDNMQQDAGHWYYGSIDVLFIKGLDTTEGQLWLRRLSRRYGSDSQVLAGMMFSQNMTERNAAQALIWARRSNAPQRKVALALIASGWLREGNRKHLEGIQNALFSDTVSERFLATRVLDSLLLPVLTMDRHLASDWTQQVEAMKLNAPIIEDAARILAIILQDASSTTCRDIVSKDSPLYLLGLYVCKQYRDILTRFPVASLFQQGDIHNAFFVADALLNTGHPQRARRIFEQLETDYSYRVNTPAASILALERLATIAMTDNRDTDASRYYREYLTIWGGLDIPLDSYLNAGHHLTQLTPR